MSPPRDGPSARPDPEPDLVDHWHEIEGWPPARALQACYLTFDEPALRTTVRSYQEVLRQFDTLDLIRPEWLHLTVQGIRFVDELPLEVMRRVAASIEDRLQRLPALTVTVERPVLAGSAVLMPVRPIAAIAAVRDVIRALLLRAHPEIGEPFVLPGQAGEFDPHISIAYANGPTSATSVATALDRCQEPPVELRVEHVTLMRLRRSDRMYHWTDAQRIPLGADLPRGRPAPARPKG